MNLPTSPAWTLQGARNTFIDLINGQSAGPGPVYNLSGMDMKSRVLSYSNGKSRRSNINQGILNNPSPTHYNPKDYNTHAPKFTFPKDQKLVNPENQNPDPTAYQYNLNYVKQNYPNYSMGYKYESIMDINDKNPGPGSYNYPQSLLSSTLKTKRSKLGTQTRFSQPNLKIPSVGQYNVSSSFINNKCTIGKQQKIKKSDNDVPGPGFYDHIDSFQRNYKKNQGKTFGKRLESQMTGKSNTTDAFNNYFREPQSKMTRCYSQGKSARKPPKIQKFPGPSDYRPVTESIANTNNRNKISFTKGSFYKKDQMIQNPGPGQYNISTEQSLKYTFSKSKGVENFNKNPGAGRYDPQKGFAQKTYKYKRQSCGNLIGRSQRTNFISKNKAGVGDYNIQEHRKSGCTIPKSTRFPKSNSNPGPGAYYLHSTISNFNFYRKRE